jgi:hypothetical protein
MASSDTPSYAAELEVLSKDEVWRKKRSLLKNSRRNV